MKTPSVATYSSASPTRKFRTLNRRNFDERSDAGLFAQNHLVPDSSFDGAMFETYGPEVEYVRETAATFPDRVMTLVDGERTMSIVHGFHFVNRIGYLITNEDVPPFEAFTV